MSLICCPKAEYHVFEVRRPPSWIFPLPVRSHSILMSPNGKPDPENIREAVEISLISCLGAEIHAFELYRPPSWILGFSPLIPYSYCTIANWLLKLCGCSLNTCLSVMLVNFDRTFCLAAIIDGFLGVFFT